VDYAPLLVQLAAIADAECTDREPAHDALHVRRVAQSARVIAEAESAHAPTAVAAALLHELFNLPKNHPDSARSGEICAGHAGAPSTTSASRWITSIASSSRSPLPSTPRRPARWARPASR